MSARGWLPISIALEPGAALFEDAAVRWIETGGTKPQAAHLEFDIAAWRQRSPAAREVEGDVAGLLREGSLLPAERPAGFVFDLSHCGSVAMANALRTADGALVLGEPQPLARLLFPQSYLTASRWLGARWTGVARAAAEALFAIYARYRTGEPERVVLKFPGANLLNLATIRAWWPEVPCLVMVRDPAEVVAANLRTGGWMQWKSTPSEARRLLGWDDSPEAIASMRDEEFGARVVESLLRAALAGFDSRCRLLDFEDLSAERAREAAAHFGLELPGGEAPRRALEMYAQHSGPRKSAGRAAREAVQLRAMPAYFDLRSL